MLIPKRQYLLIALLFGSLSMIHVTAVDSNPNLNANADGGVLLSLNITGNEYDKSINQKTHKISIGDSKISEI